jgi:predicted methyltransferase
LGLLLALTRILGNKISIPEEFVAGMGELTRSEAPPILTACMARRILEGDTRVSLDLGLSEARVTPVGEGVSLAGRGVVKLKDLERIAERGDAAFFFRDGELFQAAIADGHFYKLVLTEGAPTLEIDGVRMHRTKGTTPEADAGEKVEALRMRGGRVLDTCTGLGYTALAALRRGADPVVSVELRPEVLRIAELNPWSRGLFTDGRVHLFVSDVYTLVDAFPDGFFDCVIHDPPSFAHAGHLYGGEFYEKMHRVLRRGGRLFHYTGEPGSRYRRVDLPRGVIRRLRGAGFRRLRFERETLAVIGEKGV